MNKPLCLEFACTSIDFSVRGNRDITSEQWYAGIIYKLTVNFQLGNPSDILRNWWQERGTITPVERFEEFIETVLLASIQSKIVKAYIQSKHPWMRLLLRTSCTPKIFHSHVTITHDKQLQNIQNFYNYIGERAVRWQ